MLRKNGTNGKKMSWYLRICYMQIFKFVYFRTMGFWKWITILYALYNNKQCSYHCFVKLEQIYRIADKWSNAVPSSSWSVTIAPLSIRMSAISSLEFSTAQSSGVLPPLFCEETFGDVSRTNEECWFSEHDTQKTCTIIYSQYTQYNI